MMVSLGCLIVEGDGVADSVLLLDPCPDFVLVNEGAGLLFEGVKNPSGISGYLGCCNAVICCWSDCSWLPNEEKSVQYRAILSFPKQFASQPSNGWPLLLFVTGLVAFN